MVISKDEKEAADLIRLAVSKGTDTEGNLVDNLDGVWKSLDDAKHALYYDEDSEKLAENTLESLFRKPFFQSTFKRGNLIVTSYERVTEIGILRIKEVAEYEVCPYLGFARYTHTMNTTENKYD